jgi:hypothetical protein
MEEFTFAELYNSLQWVFSLGYVVVISIIATILLIKLERVTLLKKVLSDTTAMQKDSILGFAGNITSFIVFAIIHFANEMILQGKFLIDFNTVTESISLPAGAAIVWSGSKGVYTAIHKCWQRAKTKQSNENQQPNKNKKNNKTKNTSATNINQKSVIRRRTGA